MRQSHRARSCAPARSYSTSGGGIDVLISADSLDVTPEMPELAQRNQADAGVTNAELPIITIEDIPMARLT